MDINKVLKTVENEENECPSPSKRPKSSKIKSWNFKSVDEDSEVLTQMGVGMLESDESSSSSFGIETVQRSVPENNNDANLNELRSGKGDVNNRLAIEEKSKPNLANADENVTFVDPNESLKTGKIKISGSNIEIFHDAKSNERIQRRISGAHSKGRSPLAAVVCNNNYNNVNQNLSTIDQTTIKKQTFIPDENFFLYRGKSQKTYDKDPFKKLSDEIVLQVFKWLPKKTLIRCGYVCRRFHQLAQDESLWTRLDLGCKTLRSGALGKVVSRGVVILRLAQAELAHPVFESDSIETSPEFQTKLQYLDLSMAVISKPSLKMLLSKCRHLKKLSLEHVKLNDEICDEISRNVYLEALNLAMCEGIESWSVRKMMTALKELHSLNISWTLLSVESVNALVDNVTPNLLRINVAGCRRSMFDSHLAILATKCPGLLELDLSDCTALTSSAISIICKFKDLEYLSLSRCYSISATSYIELRSLKTLNFLDVFGLLSDTALNMLQNTFFDVGINKFIHSSVARPTVGTRRTSIWGLRTRD